MAMKRFWQFCQFCFLFNLSVCYGEIITAPSVNINTRFKGFVDKPQWLLILRDLETGCVVPYLFEIKKNNNFWIAFSPGRAYRVTASYLKFPHCSTIANFCHLESCILDGKSITVSVTGFLSGDPRSYQCHVIRYQNSIGSL